MKPRDDLKSQNLTAKDFAEKGNFSLGGVLKWVSGERFPRPDVIAEIQKITKGKVTANDFAAQQIQRQKDDG